ncbi:MAG: isochorismatase family protein, partial [Xanthobacteraceae bacterium]
MGITTLVLTGWKISGSVTYASVGATLRGYTVVLPVDATSDATDYESRAEAGAGARKPACAQKGST